MEEARKLLQNPKLEFEIDFSEMGKMLKGGEDVRDDWERNLGNFAVLYFESFVSTLKYEKFDKDDMLREGFEEAIPKMIVQFRLVEKLSSGYSEILLDDGKLVMQVSQNCLLYRLKLTKIDGPKVLRHQCQRHCDQTCGQTVNIVHSFNRSYLAF